MAAGKPEKERKVEKVGIAEEMLAAQNGDQVANTEKNTLQNIERFVQRLRLTAHQIIQGFNQCQERKELNAVEAAAAEDAAMEDGAGDGDEEYNILSESECGKIDPVPPILTFDPDSDGFVFTYDDALTLHKNINILQFVRRSLLVHKCK